MVHASKTLLMKTKGIFCEFKHVLGVHILQSRQHTTRRKCLCILKYGTMVRQGTSFVQTQRM